MHPDPEVDSVDDLEKEKLETLLEKVTTLQQILENLPLPTYNRLENLQRQVIDFSHRAEDIVDSANVDRTLIALSAPKKFLPYLRKGIQRILTAFVYQFSIQKVIEKFDSMINKDLTIIDSSQQTVTETFKDLSIVDPNPESSASVAGSRARMASLGSSLTRHFTRKGVPESQACRGLDKDTDKLKDRLTRYERALEIIPIVGLGGIGKSTLARKLYDDNISHFDCVAWATISQDYDVNKIHKILSTLVSCLTEKEASDLTHEEKVDLKVTLHKLLYGRRYLIVLDDIWDNDIWDALRPYFPENQSTSSVILTTRDLDVAKHASSSNLHTMNLLYDDDSWDLFCGKVFGEKEDLDPELERLGRTIAKNCKGLPLAISVISGLLLECDNAEGFWEHVAHDISPTVALDEQFSKILCLSYDHLPHHLRPCLLYLGAFPKGSEIRVSRIKRFWAADSFLKPIEDKTLEESAEQYLEDLENRNLVVVHERKSCGKVRSCGMHDLLKDLCNRRAEQEDFVVCSKYGHVPKATDRSIEAQSLRNDMDDYSFPQGYDAVSFEDYMFSQEYGIMVSKLLSTSKSKLVRVLDTSEIILQDHFPEEIFKLVNIRYLSVNCKVLPPLLSRLWNLIFPYDILYIDIPDEIFRH